jgi:hypothetical protein
MAIMSHSREKVGLTRLACAQSTQIVRRKLWSFNERLSRSQSFITATVTQETASFACS